MPTLLVFGARNVGRVLARELARDGWNTAAVARTQQTIDMLREQVPGALGLVAVIRLGSRALVANGGGTFVQMTGGSARRGMPNRGPWAATAFATRALTQSVAPSCARAWCTSCC